MDDPRILPPDLPTPPDDGACRHLSGLRMPTMALPGTGGGTVDLGRPTAAWAVLYCFPRASQPHAPPPPDWDRIPSARDCTAQACDFREHHQRLAALGAVVFGISTQTPAAQREVATRLRLPFELLSDEGFPLTRALGLPTFTAGGLRLLRRLTLVVRNGVIETVFYPIFLPTGPEHDTGNRLAGEPTDRVTAFRRPCEGRFKSVLLVLLYTPHAP